MKIYHSKYDNDIHYLESNYFKRNTGLTINTVGFQCIQPDSKYPLLEHPKDYFFNTEKGRVLSEYQMVYITKGDGTLLTNTSERIPISAGQLIINFPGQWHTYCPSKSHGWNEYYIGFSGHIIDNLIINSFLPKDKNVIDIGLNDELVQLFKSAIVVAKNNNESSQQHLMGIVMHMIGLILYEAGNMGAEAEKSNELVTYAKIIMHENILGRIYPEEIATELNINYTTFRKIFKQHTGYPPAKYFQELKFQKAKKLLQETACSVKEIAFALKFSSAEAFETSFRKKTGFTPTKYRNNCRFKIEL
jgi:Transcriptional regulator containing an amidase domain and an AraC-type DNA-binding HTH domain